MVSPTVQEWGYSTSSFELGKRTGMDREKDSRLLSDFSEVLVTWPVLGLHFYFLS